MGENFEFKGALSSDWRIRFALPGPSCSTEHSNTIASSNTEVNSNNLCSFIASQWCVRVSVLLSALESTKH